MIGQLLDGRYQIQALIGRGGMGTVYRADDLTETKPVAIKTLHVGIAPENATSRFYREFRVLTRIQHPHIVQAYSYGIAQEAPYLVLEYLQGHTLSDETSRGPLSRHLLLHIAMQLADALAYLHAQSIIHRDLKPGNIMLLPTDNEFPVVKLMDFGLVSLQQDSLQLTQEGSAIGTVAYMPPEQAQGFPVDFRADLYAFGAILYEMATGRPPFVHENPATVLLQHITTQPLSPRHFNPNLDEPVAQLILQLLSKEPSRRPASTKLLAGQLAQLATDSTSLVPLPPPTPIDMIGAIPLIGREKELGEMIQYWQAAQQGQGQIVLLAGVAGAGKARFLEEVQMQARIGRQFFVNGRSREHGTIPYQPLIDILDTLAQQLPEAFIQNLPSGFRVLLPSYAQSLGTAPVAGEDRLRLFTACWEILQEITRHGPLLVAVEDIQWADAATIELLTYLTGRLAQSKLMLVLAYRPEEVKAGSPLDIHLRELSRRQGAHSLKLELLNQSQVAQFLRIAMGWEQVPAWLVESFYQATGGNPLFIEETLKVLAAEGEMAQWTTMQKKSTTTTILGKAVLQLPQSVLAIAERRLQALSDDERTVLTTAAVLGPEFSFELLQAVSKQDEETLVDVVDHLLVERLIVELPMRDGEDRYAFSQEALRQALLSSISQRRRRLLHQSTGEAMGQLYDTDQPRHWPALAYHYAEGGNDKTAVKYFILTADSEAQVYAYAESIAHYSAALEIGKSGEITDLQLIHIYSQRGRMLELNLRYPEALQNYEEMDRLAQLRNYPKMHLSALLASAVIRMMPTPVRNNAIAMEVAQEALRLATELQDREAEARAYWVLMMGCNRSDNHAQALLYGEASIALSRELNLREQLAFTLNDIDDNYMVLGQPLKAQASLLEAERLWRELDNLPMLSDSLGSLAANYYTMGDLAEARRRTDEAITMSRKINNFWGLGYNSWLRSYVSLEEGDFTQTIALMDEIWQLGVQAGFVPARILIPAITSTAFSQLGHHEEAIRYAKMLPEGMQEEKGFFSPAIITLVWVYLMAEQFAEAQEWFALYEANDERISRPRSGLIGLTIYAGEAEMGLFKGHFDKVLADSEGFIAGQEQVMGRTHLIEAYYLKGRALAGLGRWAEAQACWQEADTLSGAIGSRRLRWRLWRALALAAEALGQVEATAVALAHAETHFLDLANRIENPEWRTLFLKQKDTFHL